jgi:hypothetical protein
MAAADDAITYAPCRGQQDVPALRAFFDELLPAPYPESFYREAAGRCAPLLPPAAQAALAAGGHAGMWWYSVHLAVHRGRLVGAVVVAVASLAEARAQVGLPFELLAGGGGAGGKGGGSDLGAHVLLLAVGLPPYRRRGIGSELLARGLEGALRACPALAPRVRLAFLTCPAAQAPFYEASHFHCLGVLPGHYPEAYRAPGTDGTAAVMLLQLCPEAQLAEYEPQAPGAPPNLLHPQLAPRRRMAPWLQALLMYYVLPALAVALLFGVCYALVLLGPLRGISGSGSGAAAAEAAAAAARAARAAQQLPYNPADKDL